jgi:P27 family predicted phage terminase small subunit
MGLRGPLPLRVVNNDYKPPENTPKPAAQMPKPPKWLLPAAKREWKRVAPALFKRGLLTELDRQALAQYCQAVARIEEAELALKDGLHYMIPSGRQYLKPEYRVLQDCQKEVRQLCVLFGLAPSSRMRMQLPEQVERDALEDLLD